MIDRYLLVKEDKSHNPFMVCETKSLSLAPSQGVSFRSSLADRIAQKVSGGKYKPKNELRMSKQEFQLRSSFSTLKDFGPRTEPERQLYQSVNVSDITESRMSSLFAPSTFATHQNQHKHDRIKLPSLKTKAQCIDELLLSANDISVLNTNAKEASPGAWPVAQSRAAFASKTKQKLSVSKFGLRGPLYKSVTAEKRNKVDEMTDSLFQDSATDHKNTSKLYIESTSRVGLSDAVKHTINTARHAHLNDRSYIQALFKPNAGLKSVRNAPKESLFGVNSSRDNIETLGARERDKPDSMYFKNILLERKQPSFDRYNKKVSDDNYSSL
jgi:hypothetical protein